MVSFHPWDLYMHKDSKPVGIGICAEFINKIKRYSESIEANKSGSWVIALTYKLSFLQIHEK